MIYLQGILNNKTKLLLLVLIIASIAINVYFRLETLSLRNLKATAQQSVYSEIDYNLRVNTSPNYSQHRQESIEKYLDEIESSYVAANRNGINSKIQHKEKQLRSYYQDHNGWTYLLEVDPYRWQRRVESFLKSGHLGTTQINGQDYDLLMSSGTGEQIEPIQLHFYLGAYTYKLLHKINSGLSLTSCLGLYPILLIPILIILVFWFSSLIEVSSLGGFISSITIGLSSIFLMRSSFGWFDTDIYNMIMPILIFCLLSYSFKKNKPDNYLFLALAGTCVGIYSILWQVWWLVFYLAALCLIIYTISEIISKKNGKLITRIRRYIKFPLLFLSSSYLSVLVFGGFETIKKSFFDTAWFLSMRTGLTIDNFWPNTTNTIAELQRTKIQDIYLNLGSSFVFYAGILGIISMLISSKNRPRLKNTKFAILSLAIWYIAALILTQFGRRFILFFVIPTGIAAGILWDFSYDICTRIRRRNIPFKFNKLIANTAIILIALTMIFVPITAASQLNILPFYNRSWDNMITKISTETPANAIINSWWDYGDYIMTNANRTTAMDANWPSTPKTYWVAKALTSQDETQARGIFRMLDSGSNQAFEQLLPVMGKDKYKTIALINKLVLLDKKSGQTVLAQQIPDNNIREKIVGALYNPRPGYVLISDEMLGYSPTLGMIANWDFARAGLWQEFIRTRNEDKFAGFVIKQYNYAPSQAKAAYNNLLHIDRSDILRWLTQDTIKLYTNLSEAADIADKDKIFFNNGIMLDKKNSCGYLFSKDTDNWIIPSTTVIYNKDNNRIQETIIKEGNPAYTIFISIHGQAYRAIAISSATAKSLFFKMFFMDGAGLKYFKLIHNERRVGYADLYLYKINWDAQTGDKQ